ncbi:MAG: DEAD/DEAH box helicase [Candidatus Eremiobacteraeota bacterium]|nr:DEAD/DEAH box helicase [Candidatus Eremiobacteraeota bacterium]
MTLTTVLKDLLEIEDKRDTLTRIERIPARPAEWGSWPASLRPEIREALEQKGIEKLYSHQSEAVQAALAQKNLVIVTPTASGKTLCYNLPMIQAVLEVPNSRGLYLFPTKALAQDQMAELQDVCRRLAGVNLNLGAFTYDGDTPADARRAVRSKAHVVITNPDMLHTGVLPHHTKWSRFFGNLKYVVVDELHTYRGVFGSHLANVFRRLRRICQFHGSDPVFICCSATIANPQELAESLLEAEVQAITESGAPQGEKTFLFYNPPMLNKELGIRRSYVTSARRLAGKFIEQGHKTILFTGSRLNVEVLTRYLKDKFERTEAEEGRIRGYRGGYLPGLRREIESGLRQGKVLAVVSTNALELGIDVGGLDVAILAGYPGTVASTWQQAGRAGRRQTSSVVVMIARSDPLDQFLMQHPEYFFESSPEHARINPDNPAILLSHVKCAAFELPLEKGERLGRANIDEMARYLVEKQVVHESGDQLHWAQEVYPADHISLRSSGPENFVIMDLDRDNKVIAEVDWNAARSTVYEDAIYMCEAKTYNVKRLDYAQRRAYVQAVEVDYYTDAITSTAVKVLDSFQRESIPDEEVGGPGGGASAPPGIIEVGGPGGVGVVREHGEVHVAWRVSGFKKIKFYSRENVGYGQVHLPDHEMHTTSFWLTFREEFFQALKLGRADSLEGVVGLAHCLHHLAPLYLMCDSRDLDHCVGERSGRWFVRPEASSQGRYEFALVPTEESDTQGENWLRIGVHEGAKLDELSTEVLGRFDPTLYLYDSIPGGMGLASQLYDLFPDLLEQACQMLENCPCEEGCPSCVGPPLEVGSRARACALAIARSLQVLTRA